MKTLKTLLITLLALGSIQIYANNGAAGVGQNDEACGSNSHCGQCIDTSGRGNNDAPADNSGDVEQPVDAAQE
ncbi:MAG: hypothetical protein GY909_12505 [Oligoflexia bacterium]|nr:hypothetical protein [Oligoflexia bacterium]